MSVPVCPVYCKIMQEINNARKCKKSRSLIMHETVATNLKHNQAREDSTRSEQTTSLQSRYTRTRQIGYCVCARHGLMQVERTHVGNLIMKKQALASNQLGATMIEYVLLLGLVAIIVIAAITQSGLSVRATFESVSSAF